MAKDKHKKKSKKQEPKSSSPLKLWVFALIPALLAIVLYANTFDHGYVLDDVSAITENLVVQRGTDGIGTIWTTHYRYGYWNNPGDLFRPLALTLFAWEWEMWPNDPGPAHVINVLLFAAGCVLLFFLIYHWFGRKDPWLPLIVTLLFAAHPIHTEVVANIKSADELLAFLFSALSLLALWKNGTRLFSLWAGLAAVSFFLAVSSKESVVTLVPIAPLMLIFFQKASWKKSLLSMIWLLIPFALYLVLRVDALDGLTGPGEVARLDNMLVKAKGIERFASAVFLCGMYLWKLIVPHPLAHDYSFDQLQLTDLTDPLVWASVVAYGGLIYLAVRLFLQKHPVSFAIIFFLLTFSLYSNLVMLIGTHFGERVLFIPSVGFCMAIGWLIWQWGKGKADEFKPAKALLPLGATAVVLLAYTAKTIPRSAEWVSEVDLYEADIINSPRSCRTHYRLGMAYMKEKAILEKNQEKKNEWLRKAVRELGEAVKIYPRYADAQGELGLAYQRLGYQEKAIEHYDIALEISPDHYTTLNNMGTVLFEQAKFDRAIKYFTRAIEANPRYKDAAGNLASCHGMLGHYDEALKWFKKAIEIDPNEASYYYYIGVTYNQMGDLVQAEKWFQQAYKRDPSLRPKQ